MDNKQWFCIETKRKQSEESFYRHILNVFGTTHCLPSCYLPLAFFLQESEASVSSGVDNNLLEWLWTEKSNMSSQRVEMHQERVVNCITEALKNEATPPEGEAAFFPSIRLTPKNPFSKIHTLTHTKMHACTCPN